MSFHLALPRKALTSFSVSSHKHHGIHGTGHYASSPRQRKPLLTNESGGLQTLHLLHQGKNCIINTLGNVGPSLSGFGTERAN
jgi:cysteine sulfinate desulfinase/cysteine desulfurase-like protein